MIDITGLVFILLMLGILFYDKFKKKKQRNLYHIGDSVEWKDEQEHNEWRKLK